MPFIYNGLQDLKFTKSGVVAFTGISLFLLICCRKKEINSLFIVMIWFVYNLSYLVNKYKFTKDKKDLIFVLLYIIGLVITGTYFLLKHFSNLKFNIVKANSFFVIF